MTNTTSVNIPAHVYLQRLRALGAWWNLGSSALDPGLLIQFATETRGVDRYQRLADTNVQSIRSVRASIVIAP